MVVSTLYLNPLLYLALLVFGLTCLWLDRIYTSALILLNPFEYKLWVDAKLLSGSVTTMAVPIVCDDLHLKV